MSRLMVTTASISPAKTVLQQEQQQGILYEHGDGSDEGWVQLSTTEKFSVNQDKAKEEFRTYDDESFERFDVVKNHYK